MAVTPSEYEEHRVRTADNIVLGMPVAGMASRMLALVIDMIIFYLIAIVLMLALIAVLSTVVSGIDAVYVAVIVISSLLLFMVAYFTFTEGLGGGGRSPGKRAMGIRVVCKDGTAFGLTASLIRNSIRVIDLILLPFTAVLMFLHPQTLRLGDMAAGTVVIRERTAASRAYGAPMGVTVPVQVHADPGGTLVGIDRLSGRELGALRTFFARSAVHPGQRERVAIALSARLLDRMGFASDAPERQESPEALLQRLYVQLDQQHLL